MLTELRHSRGRGLLHGANPPLGLLPLQSKGKATVTVTVTTTGTTVVQLRLVICCRNVTISYVKYLIFACHALFSLTGYYRLLTIVGCTYTDTT